MYCTESVVQDTLGRQNAKPAAQGVYTDSRKNFAARWSTQNLPTPNSMPWISAACGFKVLWWNEEGYEGEGKS